jgi:hypothetical protein
VDRYDDPIENSEEGDEAGQEPELKSMESPFPLHGIKKRNQSKPGQEFKIEIGKGEDEENS